MNTYVIPRFLSVNQTKREEIEFHCLFKAENFVKVSGFEEYYFDIKDILISNDLLLFKKDSRDIYFWGWKHENWIPEERRFVQGFSRTNEKFEFPDDESAILWYRMNY